MTEATVRTETILDRLVAGKREELARRVAREPLAAIRRRAELMPAPAALAPVLRGPNVRLIAEIKRASPSAGVLEDAFDPVARAQAYVANGAAAISILTEERQFLGSLAHIAAVRAALSVSSVAQRTPILRKDFLFDAYHLYEARTAGADAVLLIVAVLEQGALVDLLTLAEELGLSVLVEVHDERETQRALDAEATIIGINNRDLRTFETSLEITERLRPRIAGEAIVVSESGIHDSADIERLTNAGVDAILVGEALMRSGDVAASVQAFSNVRRTSAGGAPAQSGSPTGERRDTN